LVYIYKGGDDMQKIKGIEETKRKKKKIGKASCPSLQFSSPTHGLSGVGVVKDSNEIKSNRKHPLS
jgi:hypothetical protein